MTTHIKIQVPAERSGTPGLWLHICFFHPERWTITHAKSGKAVANFATKEEAKECALALFGVINWQLSEKEIKELPPEKRDNIRLSIVERGGTVGGNPGAATKLEGANTVGRQGNVRGRASKGKRAKGISA